MGIIMTITTISLIYPLQLWLYKLYINLVHFNSTPNKYGPKLWTVFPARFQRDMSHCLCISRCGLLYTMEEADNANACRALGRIFVDF